MIKKTVTAAVLAAVLLLSSGCGKNETSNTDPTRAQKIVEEIAVDYGTYGSEAKDRIKELSEELSEIDPVSAKRIDCIVDIWTSGDLGKPLNYDILPDGLPDSDELCIVVLGFQLEPDGSMKDELIQRLTVALNSAKKYPKSYIVCTGGGTAADNPAASEAGEMAKWLEANGPYISLSVGEEARRCIKRLSHRNGRAAFQSRGCHPRKLPRERKTRGRIKRRMESTVRLSVGDVSGRSADRALRRR